MTRAALLAALLITTGGAQLGCGSGDDSAIPVPGTDGAPLGPLPSLDKTLDLKAVWGAGANDVWAVGSNGLIVHYNGTSWTNQKSGVTENLTGIDGSSNHDIWVCGDMGSVLHWDGKTWSVASSTPMTVLLQVWVGSPTNVWAVGLDTYLAGAGYVKHWDGTSWVDGDDASTTSLWQVWGSGPDDVWLVGDAPDGTGVALRGAPNVPAEAGYLFDTAGYAGPPLRGVWGSGPNDVWVAAYSGDITHWNGTAWTSTPSAVPTASLLGMHGSAKDDVWAVGLDGLAEHFVNGKWVQTETGTKSTLWSLWSDGPNDVWVVGGAGTVLRWDGSEWSH